MSDLERALVVLGVLLTLAGVLLLAAERTGFRGLPGDLAWESDGVRVYVPIASCLVLSVAMSLVLWLVQRLGR